MGIRLENVDYVYAAGTAEEKKALDDINLKINDYLFGVNILLSVTM